MVFIWSLNLPCLIRFNYYYIVVVVVFFILWMRAWHWRMFMGASSCRWNCTLITNSNAIGFGLVQNSRNNAISRNARSFACLCVCIPTRKVPTALTSPFCLWCNYEWLLLSLMLWSAVPVAAVIVVKLGILVTFVFLIEFLEVND